MHDMGQLSLAMTTGVLVPSGLKMCPPQLLSPQQLKAFAVGLIDGDGSLQVNQWRRKGLQYRLIVKLADKQGNRNMLSQLAKAFKGTVRTDMKNSTVAWVIDTRFVIQNTIVPLLTEFPPLTTRIRLQLSFVVKALNGMTMDEYFESRESKYADRSLISPLFTSDNLPPYFACWLAGFIEAEGSFSCRVAGNYSFSVAQLHDAYLIQAIQSFFGQNHLKIMKKTEKGGELFEISIGSLKGVESVITLCLPLLQGYKYVQLAVFTLRVKTQLRNRFWTSNADM